MITCSIPDAILEQARLFKSNTDYVAFRNSRARLQTVYDYDTCARVFERAKETVWGYSASIPPDETIAARTKWLQTLHPFAAVDAVAVRAHLFATLLTGTGLGAYVGLAGPAVVDACCEYCSAFEVAEHGSFHEYALCHVAGVGPQTLVDFLVVATSAVIEKKHDFSAVLSYLQTTDVREHLASRCRLPGRQYHRAAGNEAGGGGSSAALTVEGGGKVLAAVRPPLHAPPPPTVRLDSHGNMVVHAPDTYQPPPLAAPTAQTTEGAADGGLPLAGTEPTARAGASSSLHPSLSPSTSPSRPPAAAGAGAGASSSTSHPSLSSPSLSPPPPPSLSPPSAAAGAGASPPPQVLAGQRVQRASPHKRNRASFTPEAAWGPQLGLDQHGDIQVMIPSRAFRSADGRVHVAWRPLNAKS